MPWFNRLSITLLLSIVVRRARDRSWELQENIISHQKVAVEIMRIHSVPGKSAVDRFGGEHKKLNLESIDVISMRYPMHILNRNAYFK